MSTLTTQPDQGRKLVIAVVGLGLLLLFAGSFVYRLQNPSLTMQARTSDSSSSMNEIAAMMARLDDEPNHLPTLVALGDQFMRMGSWDRAAVFWKRVLGIEPDQERALNGLGVAYYNLDQFPEAAEQFEKIVALQPDNYRAHFNLGMLHKHYLNNPDQARIHFERVLALDPGEEGLAERVQAELTAAVD